jgi:hypothetical protein
VEATHRCVDEIICRISDANLDCSLEDIEAIVEASGDALEAGGTAAAVAEGCRVSPEFTQAADLIDRVSPWECGGDWVYIQHGEGKKRMSTSKRRKRMLLRGVGEIKRTENLGRKASFQRKRVGKVVGE